MFNHAYNTIRDTCVVNKYIYIFIYLLGSLYLSPVKTKGELC